MVQLQAEVQPHLSRQVPRVMVHDRSNVSCARLTGSGRRPGLLLTLVLVCGLASGVLAEEGAVEDAAGEPAIDCAGTVRFDDGTSVQTAVLTVVGATGDPIEINVVSSCFATRIYGAGHHHLFEVTLDGRERTVAPETLLELDAGPRNVITLPRPRDVMLVLRGAAGQELLGATVHVERAEISGPWFEPGRSVYPPASVRLLPTAAPGPVPGSYVIADVFQSRRVWAYAPGHAWTALLVENLGAGRLVESALPAGGSLLFSVPSLAARRNRELVDDFAGAFVTYPLPNRAKRVAMDGLIAGQHTFTWLFERVGAATEQAQLTFTRTVVIDPAAPVMLYLETPSRHEATGDQPEERADAQPK